MRNNENGWKIVDKIYNYVKARNHYTLLSREKLLKFIEKELENADRL